MPAVADDGVPKLAMQGGLSGVWQIRLPSSSVYARNTGTLSACCSTKGEGCPRGGIGRRARFRLFLTINDLRVTIWSSMDSVTQRFRQGGPFWAHLAVVSSLRDTIRDTMRNWISLAFSIHYIRCRTVLPR
jgi:hypothetical protein